MNCMVSELHLNYVAFKNRSAYPVYTFQTSHYILVQAHSLVYLGCLIPKGVVERTPGSSTTLVPT